MRSAHEAEESLRGRIDVIRQTLALIDSLLRRMESVQSEADLPEGEEGRRVPEVLWIPREALPLLRESFPPLPVTLAGGDE